jgi:hypothetical protein
MRSTFSFALFPRKKLGLVSGKTHRTKACSQKVIHDLCLGHPHRARATGLSRSSQKMPRKDVLNMLCASFMGGYFFQPAENQALVSETSGEIWVKTGETW